METLFKNSGGNWNKPTIRLQLPFRCGYQLDPNSVSFWFRKTCEDKSEDVKINLTIFFTQW